MSDTYSLSNVIMKAPKGITMNDALAYERDLEEGKTAPDEDYDTQQTLETNTPKEDVKKSEDWEKRYLELQAFKDKQLSRANSEKEALKQEKTALQQKLVEANAKPKNYPLTENELKEYFEQFPDFKNVLITFVRQELDQNNDELRREMGRFEEQAKAFAAERGRADLLKLHPDANEIENDPQFVSWFELQEPEIRALIESPDAKKVAKGLTIYKKFMGVDKVKAKLEEDKEASKAVTITSKAETPKEKKVWTEREVAKMHPRVFAKYADEIDQARLEGRFQRS